VPYTIVTTVYARRDIQDAIDWENMRKPGLANYFLQDLEKKIFAISNTPFMCKIRYSNVRCAPTNIFSYLIHYTLDEIKQEIHILRVLHTSRQPIW